MDEKKLLMNSIACMVILISHAFKFNESRHVIEKVYASICLIFQVFLSFFSEERGRHIH